MLKISALMHTDLPEPVVPAMSTCGIFTKSVIAGWPAMSLPSTKVSGEALFSYARDDKPSTNLTISRLWLGISMPTTVLPAMLSTTRTLSTDSDLAKSRAKPTI